MSIFLLFIINQEIDFEDLFNRATTSLVQFQVVKDSAFEKLIEMGQDSLFADTTIDFLVSKFDTKSARERHTLKDILKKIGSPAIKGIVKKLDYRGNVLNRDASEFYRKHGVTEIDHAAEAGLDLIGRQIMKTKYCIRKQLNQLWKK